MIALRRKHLDVVGGVAYVHRNLIETSGRLAVGPPKNNSVRTLTVAKVLLDELSLHLAARVPEGAESLT